MAAQDNSGATPTSVIASEFIRAYYNALSNEPSALYAFYEDDSKFSRFEEGQVTDATPAQGQLAIHESVQSIPYAGCKVRIETTDSHDSAFGCVIVIVTGIIVLVGQPPRTFVQTFLLQPLVSGSPHLYVRNDILRYTSKITPPTTTTTPASAPAASSNHLPLPEQQHAPRPASPVATPASAPSSPKKQPIAVPASPQPVAPKSPVKKAEEPVATPEPIVAPKSPQRAPEPAPAAASPTPEEQPAAAPAEKPQRVRKDRPKREKPAAAAPAAAAPAAETSAPAAAAPAEAKQEQKAPAKVAEKPKAVAKPAPVQPPRPTTWASRLFNAAKDGPLGIAKLATGTDVEPLETAPIETAHINGGENAAAATTATTTETDQAARKPRSNKRPPSRTGKSGDAPAEKRERDPLYSLWVNNIPPQTTQPELNTLFGQYGNMRPIRLVAGKTYCFVDYYDVPSLENALRARPIKIHGVELSVDKKQMKQTPRPTSATSTTSKPTSTATPAATEDDDGFQKSTAGRSRAYKQRVASENKAAAAQQQQQTTSGARPASGAKKPTPTNGAPRK